VGKSHTKQERYQNTAAANYNFEGFHYDIKHHPQKIVSRFYGKTFIGRLTVTGLSFPSLHADNGADAARHFPLDRFTGQTQYRAKVMRIRLCI
jgi:hypothetical protein